MLQNTVSGTSETKTRRLAMRSLSRFRLLDQPRGASRGFAALVDERGQFQRVSMCGELSTNGNCTKVDRGHDANCLSTSHQSLHAFVKRMMHPAQGMGPRRPAAPGACAECQQEDVNGQAQNSGTSEDAIGQSAASFQWRAQPPPLWQLPTAGAPYCEPFHPARICIRILPSRR